MAPLRVGESKGRHTTRRLNSQTWQGGRKFESRTHTDRDGRKTSDCFIASYSRPAV
jgi:hypothetical protein